MRSTIRTSPFATSFWVLKVEYWCGSTRKTPSSITRRTVKAFSGSYSMITFRVGLAASSGGAFCKRTGRLTFLYGNHFSKITVRGFGGGVGKRSMMIWRGCGGRHGIFFSITYGLQTQVRYVIRKGISSFQFTPQVPVGWVDAHGSSMVVAYVLLVFVHESTVATGKKRMRCNGARRKATLGYAQIEVEQEDRVFREW